MAREDPFVTRARQLGLLDDRGLYTAADVTGPEGRLGRCWLLLNGTALTVCALDFPAGLGRELQRLELEGAEVLQTSRFVFAPSLSLRCGGAVYAFKGFVQPKQWIEAIRSACGAADRQS